VREDNFVHLESGLVHQTAGDNVHHIERVVLQVVPRVRRHRLVVLIDGEEGRVGILGYEGGRGHQHEPPVLGEKGTLAVELLAARRYGHREPQLEEPVEHAVADSETHRKGLTWHGGPGLRSLLKTITMNKKGLLLNKFTSVIYHA
jgi:hypothetical protein